METDFRNLIAAALSAACPLETDEIASLLETPPSPEMGDYAFPCFRLAKAMRAAPAKIAADIARALALPDGVERAEAAGPYVNFFVAKSALAARVLGRVFAEGDRYGGGSEGAGRRPATCSQAKGTCTKSPARTAPASARESRWYYRWLQT